MVVKDSLLDIAASSMPIFVNKICCQEGIIHLALEKVTYRVLEGEDSVLGSHLYIPVTEGE